MAARSHSFGTYVAFMLVGNACGWLLVNCVYQLPANYVAVSDSFFGPAAIINGSVGLIISFLFTVCNVWYPKGLSMGNAQAGVAALCFMTCMGQLLLVFNGDLQSADGTLTVILVVFTLGNVVADLTYFVAFPLITVYYSGWLVAPIRAGTDFSGLFTALLGQMQAPQGGIGPHEFPMWYSSAAYAALAAVGFTTWVAICHTKMGLQSADKLSPLDNSQDLLASYSPLDGIERPSTLGLLRRGFACPRKLVLPVVLATLSQVNYWTLGANSYGLASQMLNAPGNCDGPFGAHALRVATTLNFALVPLGSVVSSLGRCPRLCFYSLFVVQSLCALALLLCLFGVGRQAFWMRSIGWNVYVLSYGLVGGLEGYLLTMAYRYIGDDAGIPIALRDSASKLLSLVGVVAVNVPNIFIGILLSNGVIACH